MNLSTQLSSLSLCKISFERFASQCSSEEQQSYVNDQSRAARESLATIYLEASHLMTYLIQQLTTNTMDVESMVWTKYIMDLVELTSTTIQISVTLVTSRQQEMSVLLTPRKILLSLSVHWSMALLLTKPLYDIQNEENLFNGKLYQPLIQAYDRLLRIQPVVQASIHFLDSIEESLFLYKANNPSFESSRILSLCLGNLRTPLLFGVALATTSERNLISFMKNHERQDILRFQFRLITIRTLNQLCRTSKPILYLSNEQGQSPIHLAACSKSPITTATSSTAAEAITITTSNTNTTPEATTTMTKKFPVFSLQLVQLFASYQPELLHLRSEDEYSPLHYAATHGDVETAAWIYKSSILISSSSSTSSTISTISSETTSVESPSDDENESLYSTSSTLVSSLGSGSAGSPISEDRLPLRKRSIHHASFSYSSSSSSVIKDDSRSLSGLSSSYSSSSSSSSSGSHTNHHQNEPQVNKKFRIISPVPTAANHVENSISLLSLAGEIVSFLDRK